MIEGLGAAVDVAADVVGVVIFELAGVAGGAAEDGVAESGGETFDLAFDGVGHIAGGAVGDVGVGPDGVVAGGGAGGVEEALLGDEDERFFGVFVAAHGAFGGGDFFEGSAEVDGSGAAAFRGGEGDRFGDGVVDFERAGAVAESAELSAIEAGEFFAADFEELAGGDVEEDGAGGGEIGEVLDGAAGFDFAAEGLEIAGEGVGDVLGAAAGDGPTAGVGESAEDESDGGAGGGG